MPNPLYGLKERREFRRLSQTEIGQLIGVNQSHYRRLENGEVRLDIIRAKLLADYFNCSIEELM
jgi:transcriptional regulator with XRE-family HTH domain